MGIDFGTPSTEGWTEEQQKVLSIVPHVTGGLSILGSAFILYDVASDREKWSSTYHRLLFGMGIYDFLSSFATTLSTIPMPADSGGLSYGNVATCTVQGMFVHLNIASPFYNFMLSIYFLLTVTFRWRKNDIKKKIEIWLHGIPFAWALITTLIVLTQDGFNDSSLWCWINTSPKGCHQDLDVDIECKRCSHCEYYRWLFFFGPLWIAAFGTIVVMSMLVQSVRKTEEKAAKWRPRSMIKKVQNEVDRTVEKIASQESDQKSEENIESEKSSSGKSELGESSSVNVKIPNFRNDDEEAEEIIFYRERGKLDAGESRVGFELDDGESRDSLSFDAGQSRDRLNLNVRESRISFHFNAAESRNFNRAAWRKSGSSTFASVRNMIGRSKNFNSEEKKARRRASRMTRMVAGQAFRYCFVFWITWLPGSTNRILQQSIGKSYFWIMFLHVIFTPMQGFLNFFVYVDIRVQKWWKDKKKEWSREKEIKDLKDRYGEEYDPSIHLSSKDRNDNDDDDDDDDDFNESDL